MNFSTSGRFHGGMSITLVAAAMLLAAVVLFAEAWALGLVYLAVLVAGMAAILYAYCAKCACKRHCAHVVIGKLASRIDRAPGPYTRAEMLAVALAGLAMVALPQPWLIRLPGALVVFWVLVGIGVAQVRTFVCRSCTNAHCPLRVRA